MDFLADRIEAGYRAVELDQESKSDNIQTT